MVNYIRSREVADRQIKKWGMRASLRRASGDRECWALEVQLTASEKRSLKNFNSRVFIISAIDLDVPPTKEDSLITYVGALELPPLRQVAPVAPLAPGGIVVYWELQVE
jgi:hypothetical protein